MKGILRGLRLTRFTGQSRLYRKLKIPKDVLKYGIAEFLRQSPSSPPLSQPLEEPPCELPPVSC